MVLALLFAAAVAVPRAHTPVQAAAPVQAVLQKAPRKADEVRLDLSAYCDVSQQPTIMLTNDGSVGVLVEWTLTAVTPGGNDVWSNVSLIAPGQFEGWMSPASYLHLVVNFDDDGQPATQTIESSCPAGAHLGRGIEE